MNWVERNIDAQFRAADNARSEMRRLRDEQDSRITIVLIGLLIGLIGIIIIIGLVSSGSLK